MTELMAKTKFIIPQYLGFDTGGKDCSNALTKFCRFALEEIQNPTFDHYEDRNFHCRGWDNFKDDIEHRYDFVGDTKHFKSWMTLAGMIINKEMGYDVMRKKIPTLYYLCYHTRPQQEWFSGLESDGYQIPYRLDILTRKVFYNPYE
tara:strand:+ start:650 stop:1090 length:441 start_codon:yes stop_codon:yes gene_type:complete